MLGWNLNGMSERLQPSSNIVAKKFSVYMGTFCIELAKCIYSYPSNEKIVN